MTGGAIRPVRPADRARWEELYAGYAASYGHPQTAADRAVVWGWLLDPGHPVRALVAEVDGRLWGLAHHRSFPRPLSASTGVYLDDLYVDPAARGQGLARALLAELGALAAIEGASVVRWITRADNDTARRLYDGLATATSWVTYDLEPR